MIKVSDFIKLGSKELTYRCKKYVIQFSREKVNNYNCLNDYKYYITLFGVNEDSSNINDKHELLLNEDLIYFIDNEVLESGINSHSPTYIKDVIELFFNQYLTIKKEQDKIQTEYETQIKNYNEWDGVIK